MYAKRLDSDVMIDYRNFDLEASIGSEFEGVGRIKSNLEDLESSEEYIGASRFSTIILKTIPINSNYLRRAKDLSTPTEKLAMK